MLVAGLLAAALAAALVPPAAAYPRPGQTERLSVAADGTHGDGNSFGSSISADGRYVVFDSYATNLVAGDTNGRRDIFVHDREEGTVERVSVASDGTEANGHSFGSSISDDGRYVAFTSLASNIEPWDFNNAGDVFVHDRQTRTTERVSVASDGTEGNAASGFTHTVSISADGRYVAFDSYASNLVPGDTNDARDVFVHDREEATTERVSVASDGTEGDAHAGRPAISPDGRYVAFESLASNLVPGDTNDAFDVFVHDREDGTTERVSVASDGTEGDLASGSSSISADGRHVAFASTARTLVPGDTNNARDVFVHDRETGTTERVSVGSDGTEGNGISGSPSISADGRYVAFDSTASNLVPGDANDAGDVFVHDRETRATERVSVASDATEGNGRSLEAAIAADGRFVWFDSLASNLVPGDTNMRRDVFLRDRGRAVGVGDLTAAPDGDLVSVSGAALLSGQTVSVAGAPDDGLPRAGPAGAELTGASLVYRPEQEDLLVRLRLASLPGLVVRNASTGAGAPGILYGFGFELGETRYEARALRAAATADPASTTPYFALYRCDPECTEQARLTGGVGTTGAEVLVSVPLASLSAQDGSSITEARAFTAFGEAGPGALVTLDEADLPDGTIPAPRVFLAIAPAGTPAEAVDFDVEGSLSDGLFSGSLDVSSLPPGQYEVWARACLDDVCGDASVPFTR